MAKRILMVGLLTPCVEITFGRCSCCGIVFEYHHPGLSRFMDKAVPEFCNDCSSNRCDAYPGTCYSQDPSESVGSLFEKTF